MAQGVLFPTYATIVTKSQAGTIFNWRTVSPGVLSTAYGTTTTPGNFLFGGTAGGTSLAMPVLNGRRRLAIPIGH
jgi:hypothetical protein